jgi:hypothetical protein
LGFVLDTARRAVSRLLFFGGAFFFSCAEGHNKMLSRPLLEALKQHAIEESVRGDHTRVTAVVRLLERHWPDREMADAFYQELEQAVSTHNSAA